jgi:oligopeptide transport system substrate-binding protein
MARIIEIDAPWRLDTATYRNMLVQPRVLGYRKHPILHAEWAYVDVATKGSGNVPSAQGNTPVPD